MNESAQNDGDPFYWGPQRLAEELCSPNQPWFPKNPRKFPCLDVLSKGLHDGGVDGEVFLTWDAVAYLQELFSFIGITQAHHRLGLHKAIAALKQRSPAYLRWKVQESDGDCTNAPTPNTAPANSVLQTLVPNLAPLQESNAVSHPPSSAKINADANEGVPVGGTDASLEQREPTDHAITEDVGAGLADETTLQPPTKKRRLAPTAVSSAVAAARPDLFNVPTEADEIGKRLGRLHRRPLNRSGSQVATYIGRNAVRYEDMLSNLPGTEPAAENPPSLGHKLRVNRAIKALLRGNKPRLKTMVDTFRAPIESGSLLANLVESDKDYSPHLPEDDSVLAPFGQQSGDEEIDSQTAREMEEEAAEIERENRRRQYLTKEEVNEEIDDAIACLVSVWRDRKLPGLERKAHRVWTQARRNRSLRHKLRSSAEFLKHLDGRIAKARQEILDNSWTKPQAIRCLLAGCLEQSVFDQEYHLWLVETLNGPMPPKPMPIPRSPKAKRNSRLDKDEEVLTSDSDNSIDNFIVEDYGGAVEEEESDDDMIDIEYSKVTSTPVDRTLVKPGPGHEPQSELRGRDVIDLTFDDTEPEILPGPSRSTPIEAESSDDWHAESDVEMEMVPKDPDNGTKIGPQKSRRTVPDLVWQSIPTDIEISDEEKRLIERLWVIGKDPRDEVYHAAKVCEDESSFWDTHILPGLEPDTPLESTSATIARLFLYFAQPSTKFAEAVFNKVRRKNRHKVLDKKECVGHFLTLILRVIPAFPATVQLSALPGGDQGEYSQVVLDSRALHLRQQDQERIAAQERRRAELREKIALFESIPKDTSRLIVNETKEEDEGLIYIRGEPARLIKDHQVEGVRFLWNQVIANRDVVRQGCVLAHSMGLGKSMQVITFLLAVTHASKSADQSIRSQVPEDLRESRTLILCPANLSQNWRDELLTWDAQQELGSVYLVASSQRGLAPAQNKVFREEDIRKWAEDGGVLIMGYELFVSFTTKDLELADIITTKAAIVIGDEAHTIKNPFSKRRRACAKVSTPAKIALTGSPLANNVTEYYSMVDWVAPQYMGSLEEFTEVYATPIQNGLYKDPDPATKRRAYVLLRVLRESMAPKVHRCGISILREQLKPKQEFMFFIPLTEVQRKLYNAFVDSTRIQGSSSLWGSLNNLSLICMHPQCFKKKVDAVLQGTDRASNPSTDNETPKGSGANSSSTDDTTLSYEIAEKMDELMSSTIGDISDSDLQLSWRFRLLFAILDECRAADDRVLIFSRRQITLDFLEKILQQQGRTSLRLDGQTPIPRRLDMIKRFNSQKSGVEVFLISTKAGGVGLNIHGANRVIIMDFAHNPMDEQQAIGRAYRIGQEKPVFVYWFVSWGTHEAKLQSRLVYKKQLADRVVEGKDYKPWASEDNYETWVQSVWDTSPNRPLPPSEARNLGGVDNVVDRLISDPELGQGIESIVTTDSFEVEENPEDIRLTEEENESVSRLVREAQRRHEEPTDSPAPPAAVVPGPVESMPLLSETPETPVTTLPSMPLVVEALKKPATTPPSMQPVTEEPKKPATTPPLMQPLPSHINPRQIKDQMRARLSGCGDAQLEQFVQSVCQELTEKGEQWTLKRWRFLIQSLAHPRFSTAIFSQAISASFLAHADEQVLASTITELGSMTTERFGRFIAKRHKKHDDPEVSSPRQERTRNPSVPIPGSSKKAGKNSVEEASSGDRLSRARRQSV